tara:strand:- start:4260 stop:4859 length:600 start_codon:yes stop_codon:yes gene_type:complete
MKENVDFVKAQNPEYTLQVVDLRMFELYIKDKPSKLQYFFSKLNKKCYAMVSDFIRYVILYYEGGVYMDIKTRPKKPLSEFIVQGKTYVFYKKIWSEYCNHFLCAAPRHKLFLDVLFHMCVNIENYEHQKFNSKIRPKKLITELTGPKVLTMLVEEFDYDNLIKVDDTKTKKYILYSFVKYHHQHYASYKKFNEPLILL